LFGGDFQDTDRLDLAALGFNRFDLACQFDQINRSIWGDRHLHRLDESIDHYGLLEASRVHRALLAV
jgi:hypothetical protein